MQQRKNFSRMLRATQTVTAELRDKPYRFWSSQSAAELHFSREIDGLAMSFDIDWHKRKDGSFSVDVVGRGPLQTNFGAQPRQYFVVRL